MAHFLTGAVMNGFLSFSKLFCGVVYLLIRKLINVLSRSVAGNYAIIIKSVKF